MDSFGYKLLFLLHILAIIAAFAPVFVWPSVAGRLKKQQKPVGATIGELAAGNTTRLHGPALVLAGIFGLGMVGLSDGAFEFSQAWVSAAVLIWFLMLGVLFAVLLPAEKKAAAGDLAAEKLVSMGNGILSLLLVLQVIDMIWKPGR
ncbi:MAG: hypothetical protein ACR2MB_14560 [Acidimicrobiales bacterium]